MQYLRCFSTPHHLLPHLPTPFRKQAKAFPTTRPEDNWVPPLSSPLGGASIGKQECEVYVSVCDATGVFSILGMFWEEDEKDRASSSSRLCNLMVKLGKVRTS